MVRSSYGNVYARQLLPDADIDVDLDGGGPERQERIVNEEGKGLKSIFCSKGNILLIFVPLGLFLDSMHPAMAFLISFLAIIPMASIIFTFVEIFADHLGPQYGALVDAVFGNSVEIIMCVQCMRAGLVEVLQANLLGSLHWNLVLVLGMGFSIFGIFGKETAFKSTESVAAQMSCQIMASFSIVLPTMFRNIGGIESESIVLLSRIMAFVTMTFFWLFAVFHNQAFQSFVDHSNFGYIEAKPASSRKTDSPPYGSSAKPVVSKGTSGLFLALCILVVNGCSGNLVGSIKGMSDRFGIPKAFIGFTLLPIVGNSAEYAAVLRCAQQQESMDTSVDVAVGSATQIALLVIPGCVLWGWVCDNPMTMDFRNFDATVMMLGTLLVSQVLQHGNTNWVHGAMLVTMYTLVAIISWFVPERS